MRAHKNRLHSVNRNTYDLRFDTLSFSIRSVTRSLSKAGHQQVKRSDTREATRMDTTGPCNETQEPLSDSIRHSSHLRQEGLDTIKTRSLSMARCNRNLQKTTTSNRPTEERHVHASSTFSCPLRDFHAKLVVLVFFIEKTDYHSPESSNSVPLSLSLFTASESSSTFFPSSFMSEEAFQEPQHLIQKSGRTSHCP